MTLIEPSDFGLFLKEKRKAAHLTQGDLAAVINKSGQYISNIEKGKNNAPPDPSDIEALIQKLGLSDKEASLFKEKASADRGRLPNEQMDYLLKHRKLIDLINYGLENNLNDKRWAEMLTAISGGK
ncbi:MAG: XRE family transcriptional regulator [Clostridiales bacterium]|nr:XRE family transcriptional regulator [Clostridiales bacterium]